MEFLAGGYIPTGAEIFTDDNADLADRPIMNLIDDLAPLFGKCGVFSCANILLERTDGAGDRAIFFGKILVQVSAEKLMHEWIEGDPAIVSFLHRQSGYEVNT